MPRRGSRTGKASKSSKTARVLGLLTNPGTIEEDKPSVEDERTEILDDKAAQAEIRNALEQELLGLLPDGDLAASGTPDSFRSAPDTPPADTPFADVMPNVEPINVEPLPLDTEILDTELLDDILPNQDSPLFSAFNSAPPPVDEAPAAAPTSVPAAPTPTAPTPAASTPAPASPEAAPPVLGESAPAASFLSAAMAAAEEAEKEPSGAPSAAAEEPPLSRTPEPQQQENPGVQPETKGRRRGKKETVTPFKPPVVFSSEINPNTATAPPAESTAPAKPSAPVTPPANSVAAPSWTESTGTQASETALHPEEFICFNLTHALVEEKAEKYMRMFGMCTCSRCRVDVTALALNNLQPKYVAAKNRDVVPMLSMFEMHNSAEAVSQVITACKKVMTRPHHNRD